MVKVEAYFTGGEKANYEYNSILEATRETESNKDIIVYFINDGKRTEMRVRQ